MKKLGLIIKETSENRIKDVLKDCNTVIVVKYSGLSSPGITTLRKSLKQSNARMYVVKNSVARRALKSSGLEELVKSIDGPCGIIMVQDEPVAASKVIVNFRKDNAALKVEGGYLDKKVLSTSDIEALAKLPSKEALRGQVVCALNAPIAGLVTTLNQILVQFVVCLDQIKQKKSN